MSNLNSICVFCGSSEGNDAKIISESYLLGEKLAYQKITLVYGAAKIGIMGEVAEGVLQNKGKVIGVIPEFLMLKEVVHRGLDELIVTANMHERKMKMQELSGGFITLPGGFGTLEELFEIITWSQLGLHQKPIGLLNINGFYDDLLALLKNMVRKNFLKTENYELLIVEEDIDILLEKMKSFEPVQTKKWLQPDKV
ncbi:TIGR00730 family Rossman fold protein [Aquimarina muelleri]|uniref:Cytokinin riboside 5'-monophosphate phosphoribohydrolase n=1 Tax=Aquimarina muelleri TaxID=279356 RepID=A0A918N493_9FLAO|nr:TIGR00730 family Rossman fold protein [Aquimarina muelleri]MCX2763385.1 TIGR00730 family Rossman fold protein [Aquimarina muelleri]GGX28707.1 cytokinin riboside 5'-monophosphate phosphoribohydrolase [Aquimarina muelleri]